ncbi:hypothetical protein FE589_10685 [Mannheimia varigena]|nr:hypothetical protein FE589_10685 [Mannheimia varigena]
MLKSKIKRRTGIKLNLFTTVRRCVECIIEKSKMNASAFCKIFQKNDRLHNFATSWLNYIIYCFILLYT